MRSPDPTLIHSAVDRLRGLHARAVSGEDDLIPPKEMVVPRYSRVFAPENLAGLSADDFLSFLNFKNNRHWHGIHRQGTKIVRDMPKLRKALGIILDDSRPLRERLDEVIPGMVPGLGKAVVTAILIIVYQDRYAVWNRTAQAGMTALDVWPEFGRGATFGERYEAVNRIEMEVARLLGVDTWTLDALWWRVVTPQGVPLPALSDDEETAEVAAAPEVAATAVAQRFGLERHLHEFLRDNWDRTTLSQEWKLHEEDGDLEAGYEYPTDVGRIDLLARHRTRPAWLVVELKRGQTSDQTVGQVARYMGWIEEHVAEEGDTVEGLVIAHEADEGLRYALRRVRDVSFQLYEVEFRLRGAPTPEPGGRS